MSATPARLKLTPRLVQVSKISLVDLAGSERADSTGARGTRLKVKSLAVDVQSVVCAVGLVSVSMFWTAGRSQHQQIPDYAGKSHLRSGRTGTSRSRVCVCVCAAAR